MLGQVAQGLKQLMDLQFNFSVTAILNREVYQSQKELLVQVIQHQAVTK